MEVVDPHTGEVGEVQIFVAALGASSYTYAEAQQDQSLSSWIGGHIRAFEDFGGDLGPTATDGAIELGQHLAEFLARKARVNLVVNPPGGLKKIESVYVRHGHVDESNIEIFSFFKQRCDI